MFTNKQVIGLGLSSVLVSSVLAACGGAANIDTQEGPANASDAAMVRESEEMAAVWNASAHEHTAAEIAKLALHRSKDPAVLAYAKDSQLAHEEAYRALRTIGEKLHMPISKIMTFEGEKQYAKLFMRGSATFDGPFKETLKRLQTAGIDYAQALQHATSQAELQAWAVKSVGLYNNEQLKHTELP